MGDAENKRELVTKLKALAARRGETWAELFGSFDADADGELERDELAALLAEADVGSSFTRGMWAKGILEHLDRDSSSGVSLLELNNVINANEAPKAPKATGTKPPPLTRAEARVIALQLATSSNRVDMRAFSQADLALVEEENLKLTGQSLGKTAKVPPIPPSAVSPRSADKSADSAKSADSGAALWLVLGVLALLALRR